MMIRPNTRAGSTACASTIPPERPGCADEELHTLKLTHADRSLYAATRAANVPRPTAHSAAVGETEGDCLMPLAKTRSRGGYVHTPAACRLPRAKPRKWRPAVQTPLPLPEPHGTRGGHEQATSTQGGCR